MSALSKLERVNLRTVWGHEAYDFTRWLAEPQGISELGEAIGLDLEIVEQEASVGTFSLDILAIDTGTGNHVVIENQLEKTDHPHLGQILTYAAGYDAETVIWIAANVREEHQKAVDWLNERTNDKTAFFLIQIELWRIGNSAPAPRFNIVSSPNAWAKSLQQRTVAGQLTETKRQQLDFWTRYREFALQDDVLTRLQTPGPQHWYDYSIGTSAAHISLTVNSQNNQVAVEIYITDNKELFYLLQDNKETLELEIGNQLEWIDSKGKAARIKLSRSVPNIFDEESQSAYFEWLYAKHCLFEAVFRPQIATALAELASHGHDDADEEHDV